MRRLTAERGTAQESVIGWMGARERGPTLRDPGAPAPDSSYVGRSFYCCRAPTVV